MVEYKVEKQRCLVEYKVEKQKCLGCGVVGELMEVRRIWWCQACGTMMVLAENVNVINPIGRVEVPALLREKKISLEYLSQRDKNR
jgi:hypothetical protein